ncbi:MAG: septum formation initiator family protein [Dehalococcoidia bacterium]
MPGFSRLQLLPAVIGAAIIVIVYLVFTTGNYVVHYYQLRSDERELRQEIVDLGAEQEQLTAVRDYLESDEYVEEVARRTLGLVRPGETLVIVSGTDALPSATPAATAVAGAVHDEDWWKALFVPTATASP